MGPNPSAMRVTTILCHPGRPSSAVFRQNFDLFSATSSEFGSLRFSVADISDVEHHIMKSPGVKVFVLIIWNQLCLI